MTKGMRSFRFILAMRGTAAMTATVGLVSLLAFLGLRQGLDRELDASLLNVARIQAAAVTGDPTGEMRFPEWELTPEEAASVRDLNRYTQIWSADGESLVRGRYITEDLPVDSAALARASEDEVAWAEGVFQGIPIRSLYYPLERMGALHNRHVLQVAAPLDARDRMLWRVGLLLLAVLLTTAGGTFAGSWWLADRIVRPVDTIVDQAESIAAGDPRRTIEAFADTLEYKRLVSVLNRMLHRLDSAVEAQRRFTADASHELRTPLTVLRGELEVALRRDRSTDEYRRVLKSSLEEAERLSRLAEDLLTLTRSEAGGLKLEIQEDDLTERVRRAVDRLSRQAAEKGIDLDGADSETVWAPFDPDLMDRVIWNLLGNALKFTPPGGRVNVDVRREAGQAVIEVADSGPGIPVDQTEAVFHRFHRIDEARTPGAEASGAGLGLAIVKAIVELHGGSVSAGNRPQGGAVFRVSLPAV